MLKFLYSIFLWSLIHFSASGTTNSTLLLRENFSNEKHLETVLSSQSFVTTGEATFSILFWDLYKKPLKNHFW